MPDTVTTIKFSLGALGLGASVLSIPLDTTCGQTAATTAITAIDDTAADRASPYPMPFPEHTGKNLFKDEITIPEDLEGRPALLHVSFDPEQRPDIDSWHEHTDDIKDAIEGVRIYEVAAISTTYRAFAGIIRGKMKDVLTTEDARETCVTFYTDPEDFAKKLGLDTTEVNHAVLLDARGRIIHAERKGFAPKKLDELVEALKGSKTSG